MSWNVTEFGKVGALKQRIANKFEQLASHHMCEEELNISQQAGNIVKAVLENIADADVVKIVTYGSCSSLNTVTNKRTHTLHVEVETLFGFVE